MKPASTDELAERLQVLFASLPFQNPGDGMDLRMKGYVIALRTFSAETLSEAIVSILDGSAGLTSPFVPTPPELANVCRAKDAARWNERKRLEISRDTIAGRHDEPTREEQARVAAKADMLIEQLKRTAGDDPGKRAVAESVSKALAEIADKARRRPQPSEQHRKAS